jgi:hypothetical protein
VTGSSRRSKWIYHLHTSEPGWERYAQDIMWAQWDPHWATWRCASTQDAMCPWHLINPREALSTNQTPPHVQHKDSRAHYQSKPPSTDPYIESRLGNHVAVTQTKGSAIRADSGSANPTLRRFVPIFHMSSPQWILGTFQGCSGVFSRWCSSL